MSGKTELRRWGATVSIALALAASFACKPSDRDIEAAVIVKLAMHPRTRSVEVVVRDGAVQLNGEIDTRDAQREAEQIARSVDGVRTVENRLRLSDRTIQRAVQEALAREPLLAGIDIEVTVNRGVVRLEGGGTDRTQRARAIGTTAQIDGVVRIDDFMR